MGEALQSITNNEEWRKEKLDFICSVVPNVDQDSLLAELGICETDEDAEGLMQSLILMQDQENLLVQNDIPPDELEVHDNCLLPIAHDIIVRLPEVQDQEEQAHLLEVQDQAEQAHLLEVQDQEEQAHLPEVQDEEEQSHLLEVQDEEEQSHLLEVQDEEEQAHLPQVQDEEQAIQLEDPHRSEPISDGAVSEPQEENSDSEDSCYFTPELPEGEEFADNTNTLVVEDITNIVEVESVDDEAAFAADIAQAIAESSAMTGAIAKVTAKKSETDSRIMSQVSILASLFSNADPDFLQERIDDCMKLEGDEERFQEYVEAYLEVKNYPTMKDYLKRQKQASRVVENGDTEEFEIIENIQVLAENLTIECGICLEENILGIDTSTCSALKNEHTYCNQCIKRYVETQIGQGLTIFKCMEGYCSAEFSLRMLQKLFEPSVFAKIWERQQQDEITAAGVENLESCPFCSYMVSMPNEDDKIFQCWSPDCMIDSCRKCKEPSHIPLRCEEIEKKRQMNARVYMENEMAEAMIRECPRCKKRFIIEAGCNRMTCPCGAVMCYVCKNLIDTVNGDGYSHFERGPVPTDKCPLYSNAASLHAEEVRGAAERAKQELDPEVTLVHDPTRDLL